MFHLSQGAGPYADHVFWEGMWCGAALKERSFSIVLFVTADGSIQYSLRPCDTVH